MITGPAKPGWRTSELWLAVAAIVLSAWLVLRGHEHAATTTSITAAAYALGRSMVKAILVFERSIMLDKIAAYITPVVQKEIRKLTDHATPRVQAAGDQLVTDAVTLAIDVLADVVVKDLVQKIAAKNPAVAQTVTEIIGTL